MHKKKYAERSLWALLITTVCISFLTRYNLIKAVDYSNLIVQDQKWAAKGKRVLVLDDDFSIYKRNPLASPFFDWNLSKRIFSGPDYYENVIKVHQGIVNDPPDIIRDRQDMLKPFLDRIPALRNLYVREGVYYVKRPPKN